MPQTVKEGSATCGHFPSLLPACGCTHSAWFSNLPSRPCFAVFFPIRLRDRRVWRRYGNLLIWIFRNDVVLLVREAEDQHCAALVRASAARHEEESGAGLVRRNLAEGFPVFLSKP